MIVDGLIAMLCTFLDWAYDLLPDWDIDIATLGGVSGGNIPAFGNIITQNHTPLQMVLVFMRTYNNFIPFNHLIFIVNFMATLYIVFLTYKFAKWIIGVLRGSGTQ